MKRLHVISSKPLGEARKKEIEKTFNEKLGKSEFKYEIDASLIGGVKIIDGDTIYDGSIKEKLEKIKKVLKS